MLRRAPKCDGILCRRSLGCVARLVRGYVMVQLSVRRKDEATYVDRWIN
jgi:hypothetical protein